MIKLYQQVSKGFEDTKEKNATLKKIAQLSNQFFLREPQLPGDAARGNQLNLATFPMDILNHIFSLINENARAPLKEVCTRFALVPAAQSSYFTDWIARAAAEEGSINLLEWARPRYDDARWKKEGRSICSSAAKKGKWEALQWARVHGCSWNEDTCNHAALYGHFAFLQRARESGCPWDALTCAILAEQGALEILQWAKANGCPWDANTCSMAALNGHLEVLQWARANDCPWDAKTCSEAAAKGHLEILQWVRNNGCPWDANTCSEAAKNGHLEVLRWARENGCPWNADTCYWAARQGHLKALQWAIQNGAPHNLRSLIDNAGSEEVRKWLESELIKRSTPPEEPDQDALEERSRDQEINA